MTATDPANASLDLAQMYSNRFNSSEQHAKQRVWQVLCQDFFQRYVRPSDTVLDVGAGYCEFINNIVCASKIALDLSEDTARYAARGVRVIRCQSNAMDMLDDESVDVAFASNFFEHMPSKAVFSETLFEIRRVLRPGGRLLILQPNIRFVGGAYWDFLDHHIPLTDRTLVEALLAIQMRPVEVIPRFLPYTTKSRLPQHPLLVRLYLRIPLAHRFIGKQAWVVAVKPADTTNSSNGS